MPSKNHTPLANSFEIIAKVLSPGAISEKIKSHVAVVEISLRDEIWQQMNQAGKLVYAIFDFSDSVHQSAGQINRLLGEISNRIDARKDRLLIYALGETEPVGVAGMAEADSTLHSEILSKEAAKDHYRHTGTFIAPTLKAILHDYGKNASGDEPVLMIFSDAELWDWELYREFLRQNRAFRVGFFEMNGPQPQTPIVEKVREANKQQKDKVVWCDDEQAQREVLDGILLGQSTQQSVLDRFTLLLHFGDLQPTCVIDFLSNANIIDLDSDRFEWAKSSKGLAKRFFHRLYLLPHEPEALNIESKLSKTATSETVEEKISIKMQQGGTIEKILPNAGERKHFIRHVERIYAEMALWAWDQQLVQALLKAIISSKEEERNLAIDTFDTKCKNAEFCGLENNADDWIARAEPTVKCRDCKQILLHNSKLETFDPKFHGANFLLLEFHISPDESIELIDEPICLNPKDGHEWKMHNFAIREKGELVVLEGKIQHNRIETTDDTLHYKETTITERHQLMTFDVIKPGGAEHADHSKPDVYYLFLDISKIV